MAFPFRPDYKEDLHPRGMGGKWVAKAKPANAPRPQRREPAAGPSVPGKTPGVPEAPKPKKPTTPKAKRGKGARPKPMRHAERQAEARKKVEAQQERPAESTQEKQVIDAARLDLQIGRRPDGTMDWEARAAYMDDKLTQLFKDKVETITMFRDKNGEWTPERRAAQQALINHLWETRAAHVPNEGQAIFSGGLGGAGKGRALKQVVANKDDRFFEVNADVVKEEMARRDMVPVERVDPNMTPMELSPICHEEASLIAQELAQMAYAERKNIIWDYTMSSVDTTVTDRLEPMRKAGYSNIGALFVDTTVDWSKVQARGRWQRGMQDYIGYEGDGGRFLPSGATKGNLPSKGSPYDSKNRETFEQVKGLFDGTVLFKNVEGTMTTGPTTGKGLPA